MPWLEPWIVPDQDLVQLCDNGQPAPTICNSEQHVDLSICECVWNLGWGGTGTGTGGVNVDPANSADLTITGNKVFGTFDFDFVQNLPNISPR